MSLWHPKRLVPPPTGNEILEKIQTNLGVWWFNNNWLPSGMVATETTGTGTLNWSDIELEVLTGTTTGSYALAYKRAVGLAGAPSWAKKRWLGVNVRIMEYSTQFLWFVSGYHDPDFDTNTNRHIGFLIYDGDVRATVGNGTTQATATLETLTTTNVERRYECIYDPNVPECKFYVNGELKATLTTSLPTGLVHSEFLFRARR